jgi:TolB-like protein
MDAAAAVMAFSFEGFVLDLGRGSLLTRAGEEIPLRRQSFELLRLLVENAGRLLDRGTINRVIWPDVAVTDDSITQCVSDIRRAIGDNAQRTLKTVLRRGYLFAARVETQCYPQTDQAAPYLALPDKPSIAVLPFQNMSGDPEQEYFADGMVEEITIGLSRIRSLFVISRNSAFTYKGGAVDVRQVGRELGVRYVLEGSVRKAGNRVRITGQLVEAATGSHIWADRFDGSLEDVFELQDQVTASVIAAIEPNLRAAETERARRKPVENLRAYDLMLRALPRLWTQTRDGVEDATRLLRGAIEIDPSYAPAAAYLAWCLWFTVSQNWIDRSDPAAADMVQLAQTSVTLDPDDPEVLTMAGGVIALPGGDLTEGILLSEKAISLNPNNAQALRQLGQLYAYAGD